jgi:hypothetical protein
MGPKSRCAFAAPWFELPHVQQPLPLTLPHRRWLPWPPRFFNQVAHHRRGALWGPAAATAALAVAVVVAASSCPVACAGGLGGTGAPSLPWIRADGPIKGYMTDNLGRVRLFHGVSAVNKGFPWCATRPQGGKLGTTIAPEVVTPWPPSVPAAEAPCRSTRCGASWRCGLPGSRGAANSSAWSGRVWRCVGGRGGRGRHARLLFCAGGWLWLPGQVLDRLPGQPPACGGPAGLGHQLCAPGIHVRGGIGCTRTPRARPVCADLWGVWDGFNWLDVGCFCLVQVERRGARVGASRRPYVPSE